MPFPTLSADVNSEDAKYRPYINTGGPLDIINGKFIPSTTGSMILSGGLGVTTAFIAEANKFKSTALNGSLVNGMARFPESRLYLYDSEYSTVDKSRLANMSSLYLDEPDKREVHLEDMKRRMRIFDPATDEGSSLDAWFDYMKEIRDEKVKHAKDWEVETEILDPDTNKPYRMMLPTFVSIDSWTEAHVRQLNIKNEEFNADTEMKEQRTIYLEEASKKTQLMRQLPSLCMKAGIYCGMTGHLGKKFSIDGKPTKKDMAYMGQDQTVKSMSNKFYFLMSSIFMNDNTEAVVHATDKRESDYPSSERVSSTELQRIKITLSRCKNAPSGSQITLISSQRYGIMPGLSNYDYLRANKNWNLGSPNKVRNPLLGDMDIGRTKIFEKSRDYKVARAMELTAQLFVIQNTWSLTGQPVDYAISLEEFIEKLHGSGYAIDDILNSRGWWTYTDAKADRPYLSLPDVLRIANGTYKPKLHPVS